MLDHENQRLDDLVRQALANLDNPKRAAELLGRASRLASPGSRQRQVIGVCLGALDKLQARRAQERELVEMVREALTMEAENPSEVL